MMIIKDCYCLESRTCNTDKQLERLSWLPPTSAGVLIFDADRDTRLRLWYLMFDRFQLDNDDDVCSCSAGHVLCVDGRRRSSPLSKNNSWHRQWFCRQLISHG